MHSLEDLQSGALNGVTRLTLSCDLETFPSAIFDLADSLEVLDLSHNQLSELPDDLSRLHRLRVLFASNNRLERLPSGLGACQNLALVGVKANQIRAIPGDALPARLRWLILTDNRLETLPAEIGRCRELRKLMLAGNGLRALPNSLAECRALELLRIAANNLDALPDWLADLPRLSWLAFSSNPCVPDWPVQDWPVQDWPVQDLHTPDWPVQDWPARDWPARGWPAQDAHPIAYNTLTHLVKLGEGASGEIFRAQLGATPVAVKLFKGDTTSDGLPAAELAACLHAGRHPNLIPILGRLIGAPNGRDGLVMNLIGPQFTPLAAPPSLETCTRDVYRDDMSLAVATARTLSLNVAQAMQHLHARGLLHGDLYAHNILHSPGGDALLGDFGAASGLPSGEAQAWSRLDVRAFGCLLEELGGLSADVDLSDLARVCLSETPAERPTFADLVDSLQALAGA